MNQVRHLIGFRENMDTVQRGADPIGICILDSGIEDHMDFKGRIVAFRDFVNGRQQIYDDYGHGTHIAGICGGSGVRSGGRYRGIAAHTHLVVGKVLNEKGDGRIEDFIHAIEWCIEKKKKYHIRVLNISVGLIKKVETDWQDELLAAVEEAWDNGIVTICAAGNNGPKRGSVTIPGTQPKVITVGSADYGKSGFIPSSYSGRGPTECCVKKPEIYAPGSGIVSCSHLGGYVKKTGTSMSVPIVTGAVALLLQQKPFYEPVDVKLRLYESARHDGKTETGEEWGALYLPAFLGESVN